MYRDADDNPAEENVFKQLRLNMWVQHDKDAEVEEFRPIIESLMILAASQYGLNTDFKKLVNPTGRFVLGGSFADCGVTGRKLACDTYGGVGHIGGGAMSGKDPSTRLRR